MTERIHRLRSAHLGNERTLWVQAPATDAAARHLTIFLDGENYRDKVGATSVISDLQARSAIAPSWFVYVAYERDEFRWLECPCYPPFARFIVEELLPWLGTEYPATTSCGDRVLVGLSYTGLAAAFTARQAPGIFSRVIAQSGSFWWNDGWLIDRYASMDTRLPTEFYLDVGTREIAENVRHKEDVFQAMSQVEATRRFRDVLIRQGYQVRYREFDGGHECVEWGKTLPAALTWALPPREVSDQSGGK